MAVRDFATTAKGIRAGIQRLAPDVAVDVEWEEDPYYRWDGDGPDPAEQGYVPYNVTVMAEALVEGPLEGAVGKDYLGGVYELPYERDPDIHGYFPDMVHEALDQLHQEISGRPHLPSRKEWDPRHPTRFPREVRELLEQISNAIKFVDRSRDAIHEREERRARRRRR